MRTIANRRVEVTVRRPDGKVETLTHPKIDYMTPSIFDQTRKAMSDAGRGEVISYRNIDAVVEMEESDYQSHCERCGAAIDTRNAYHQKECMSIGNSTVMATAYYCSNCHQILANIGMGERTPMEERATNKPDNTPYHKED